jgi:hypothetical protein
MGNKAKRRQLAQALKAHGFSSKLYRGNKRIAWRYLRGAQVDTMLRKLNFKSGTIVHDCIGYNERIAKWIPERIDFARWLGCSSGGYVFGLDQFQAESGYWSCGCSGGPTPAEPREKIEKEMRDYLHSEQMASWLSALDLKTRDALDRGEHVCDENGILLDEYRRN